MKPFLYSIAETYLANEAEEVMDYCFVFPNKRSAVFFHHAFAIASRRLGKEIPHPATITISDFIESFVKGVRGERMEMIFILYQSYREVIYRHAGADRNARALAEMVDFNRFQRWADMLLGDFNDVDMYMVDPSELFPNLERYREISANYIEPEVLEEIKRHWRVDRIPEYSETFWNHIIHDGGRGPGDNGSEPGQEGGEGKAVEFFKLWQVMQELYLTFREKLRAAGMFYSGMAYTDAATTIKDTPREGFRYHRYIFTGFNMLSKVEEHIFSLMKEKKGSSLFDNSPFADFYFDDASPAFAMEGNTTSGFLRRYVRMFPSVYDCVEPVAGFPKIEITGVASVIGQAKLAGAIVASLYPEGIVKPAPSPDILRKTAIVLPQESLAQGILSALPGWISPINLTMGYRLRDSQVAGLVRNIVSMHLRSRKSRGAVPTFYYEDVLKVLTHPLLHQTFPTLCNSLVYDINVNRRYNIEAPYIASTYPGLKTVFSYVEDSGSADEVFGYFENLFLWLLDTWKTEGEDGAAAEAASGADSPEEDTENEPVFDIDGHDLAEDRGISPAAVIDRMLARAYLRAISRLRALTERYLGDGDIYLADTTLFHLMERIAGGETVNFEGRPLNGLQIMGVLEARSLDFENIIIPSMNEKIFPKAHYQKSFIPPHLRKAYGMATQDHQESIFSYYFYRMISRARRVFLIYDARTQGVGGGQMSRYLNQLIHLYRPASLTSRVLGFGMDPTEEVRLEMRKSPEIMAELEKFRSDENPRHLSASALNTYINCPLSFYLTYIAGYKREDEFHDYMDQSTFGTILHGVLEDLYKQEKASLPGGRFTRGALDALMRKEVEIERAITIRINRHYNLLGDNNLASLKGDAEIFGSLMKKYILLTLRREIEAGEFEFLHGEYGSPFRMIIRGNTGSRAINFKFSIDRVDRLYRPDGTSVLRVIDYKTGEDPTEIIEIEDMFRDRSTSTRRAKAMLQLFLYCQALSQREGLCEPVEPWIYSLRKVATTPFSPLKINGLKPDGSRSSKKVAINDYRDYVNEVNDRLLDILDDFFNPEIPFTAAEDPHACHFCKFSELCRKKSSST